MKNTAPFTLPRRCLKPELQELARDQAPALARLARRGCQIPQNFLRHKRNHQNFHRLKAKPPKKSSPRPKPPNPACTDQAPPSAEKRDFCNSGLNWAVPLVGCDRRENRPRGGWDGAERAPPPTEPGGCRGARPWLRGPEAVHPVGGGGTPHRIRVGLRKPGFSGFSATAFHGPARPSCLGRT